MTNKTPNRQCISCRTKLVRGEFIRLTKIYDSKRVIINPDKYQLGRSAYICKSAKCINLAIKEKKVAKMLKVSTKSTESIIPELEKYITLYSASTPKPSVKGVLVKT